MERTEYKKFLIKTFLFLIPFLVMLIIELTLPINYFTKKFWEALRVYSTTGRTFLTGPFYPNVQMSMDEYGDLGVHTIYQLNKRTEWVTNDVGYRTEFPSNKDYDVIVIGDSTSVGSELDQKDTLQSQLSKSLGTNVYGMGGILLQDLYNLEYINNHKPKFIVLSQMEMTLLDSPAKENKILSVVKDFSHKLPLENFNGVFILVDRTVKQNMYHSMRANVQYFLNPKQVVKYDSSPMLFYRGIPANKEIGKESFDEAVDRIVKADKFLKEKGITLIIAPVPNKESIYFDAIPGKIKPHFIPDLVKALKDKGVVAVDTQSAYLDSKNKDNKTLYLIDDTHWNKDGVNETVKLVSPIIMKSNKI